MGNKISTFVETSRDGVRFMSPYSKNYPTDAMLDEVMERVRIAIAQDTAKAQRELDRRLAEVAQRTASKMKNEL